MKKQLIMPVLALLLLLSACTKENENPTSTNYEIPETYTFSIVNYTGQTQRLLMTDELVNEVKKANVPNTQVSATKLREMYSNLNNPFADALLNASGKQLKDKTFLTERATIESYFDSLEMASKSTIPGSEGTAGVVTSNDGTRKYLLSAKGIEYKERIDKGLMMALMYYQITSIYLSPEKMNVDNSIIDEANGTAMQHHWDEAFGYLSVPTDFPNSTIGIKYLSKYINARNAVLDCNKTLMNAFIKGRAAINNNDYTTRDTQIDIIVSTIEKTMAASAINYLNQAKTNFADNALRCHTLSECYGFIYGLKFNDKKKITNAQIDALLAKLGDNYYSISLSQMEEVKADLAAIYNLTTVKDIL